MPGKKGAEPPAARDYNNHNAQRRASGVASGRPAPARSPTRVRWWRRVTWAGQVTVRAAD